MSNKVPNETPKIGCFFSQNVLANSTKDKTDIMESRGSRKGSWGAETCGRWRT